MILGGLAQAAAPPPIVGGARTQAHPAVGALVAYDASRGGASFCSGTLIDARWVVTAAHCLEAMNQYRTQGFDLVVVFGDDIFTEAGNIDAVYASSWTLHPDYGGEAVLPPVADVGVVRLDRAARDVEALPMNTDAPSSRWLDADLTLVGWGLTSDDANDAGRKRAVDVPVDSYDGDFVYVWSPGTNVCQGDSGGPALLPDEDGALVLAGIHSFVFSEDASVPPCAEGGAGAYRVDKMVSWIRNRREADAGAGGGSVGGGGVQALAAASRWRSLARAAPRSPRPSPPAAWLGVGLVAGLCGRRRVRRGGSGPQAGRPLQGDADR